MISVHRLACHIAVVGLLVLGLASVAVAEDLQVGDAYAYERSSPDGPIWTIGNGAMEQVFAGWDGWFRLISYKNKLTNPPAEYVDKIKAEAPFSLDAGSSVGPYSFEELWEQKLGAGNSVDFAKNKVTIAVKKGDLIGFSATPLADSAHRDSIGNEGNDVDWPTILQYANGRRFSSDDDLKLAQGPMFFYYLHGTGTGCLDLMEKIMEPGPPGDFKEKRRALGYRAPWEAPTLGTSIFTLKNSYSLVRAWRAPADGTVTVRGEAKLIKGPEVQIRIINIKKRIGQSTQPLDNKAAWTLKEGKTRQVNAGGRPAAQLDLTLTRQSLRAQLHILVYPGTSVMRQWLELENTGTVPQTIQSPAFAMTLSSNDVTSMTRYWLNGGTCTPTAGILCSAQVTDSYHAALLGEKTDNYVPWTALQRQSGGRDGCYVALDYLGTWTIGLDHESQGKTLLSVMQPSLVNRKLATGERLELRPITMGVFQKDLDDMGRRVYDWQYEYLWDYTNPDFYAQSKWGSAWFICSNNLQEQFTTRLANLDMEADIAREIGYTLIWDDAGWSKYPTWPIPENDSSVYIPTHEGPDFAQTLNYLNKMDMKWLAWFNGPPTKGMDSKEGSWPTVLNTAYGLGYSQGLMNSKVGAWGDFQWRTDGVGRFDINSDKALRRQVENFLTLYPRSSFHTCDGGSRYAHQFEIQRYADVNYLSDLGRGPEMNYYFSYLEPPDKWSDMIEINLSPGFAYRPSTARSMLTTTPGWAGSATAGDKEHLRLDAEIYRFLLHEGVAGRWSYVFHPVVTGDDPTFYFQRSNHERTKACIIFKHQAKGGVTIRPAGLLPEHDYVVGFDSTRATSTRTGTDLMTNGITIKKQAPGEIIYLGLPDRPGSGYANNIPQAPGRVLLRREVNIGHSGVGIYWSTAPEDHWISYYEIERNGKILGKISTGAYYFDWSTQADLKAIYSVRTVDGNGNKSAWTDSTKVVPGDPLTAAALGGYFPEWGRDGWQAETTTDGATFAAMKLIPPTAPNQPGGEEGYWEGAKTARVGRGWQQTSKNAACVRTWIAPKSGYVRVIGRAMKECYRQDKGSVLRVRILLNKQQVWPKDNWAMVPLNDLVGATHDLTLKVKAGDALRFVLDRSADPELDIVAWMPQIIYPEKARRGGQGVVRILCGAEQKYKDHNGNTWSSDRYFTGGERMNSSVSIQGAMPTEQDQPIYQAGRHGRDFSYAIPLKPGLYSVRLKFAEPEHEWSFERPINVDINGHRVLSDYDICAAAKGWRKAHERTFRNLVPNDKGQLVLHFTAGYMPVAGAKTEAMVQAIEVLPEVSAQPQRIDVGSPTPFIDWAGAVWEGDKEITEANSFIQSSHPVRQASPTLYDQALYQTACAGQKIGMSVKALPGHYTVHLKFAELWINKLGERPMDIEINGKRFWHDWDPASSAEMIGMASDLRADGITPDSKGRINVTITATGKNDAILQGIEITSR